MSQDINDLEKQFKESDDYTNAQFKLVVELQKKVKQLQERNEHLKVVIEKSVPTAFHDVRYYPRYYKSTTHL